MSGQTTFETRFSRLAARPKLGSVLVRLMMALNDISLADDGMGRWQAEEDRRLKYWKTGARRYFLRTLLGHVFEALGIVREIAGDADLMRAVEGCDARTQASFAKLQEFLKSADYRLLLRIRNNLAFHYDDKLVARSIKLLAERFPRKLISCSLGNEAIHWHFMPGEWVENDVIVRAIFGIADVDEKVAQEKTDEIVVRIHSTASILADFAGHFIKATCQENV